MLLGSFAVAAAGCAGLQPRHARRKYHLRAVKVAADREIRTVVGLRPFRPSGFVVRAEKLGDKLVVHDYGHGGAGLTLSWGTAQLAIDLAAEALAQRGRVAVLGCGAVGLATARLLQQRGLEVTIYARAAAGHHLEHRRRSVAAVQLLRFGRGLAGVPRAVFGGGEALAPLVSDAGRGLRRALAAQLVAVTAPAAR